MNRTEIVNYALAIVGNPRITSLSEGSSIANRCASLLPVAIDQVCRQHDWPSLIVRVYLASVEKPDTAPYTYMYMLPEMVRALDLVNTDSAIYADGGRAYPWQTPVSHQSITSWPYVIESGYLYTDATPALLRYVAEPGETIVDSLLAQTIGLALAARLAIDLENNQRKQQAILAEYQNTLRLARSIASGESGADPQPTAWWYP